MSDSLNALIHTLRYEAEDISASSCARWMAASFPAFALVPYRPAPAQWHGAQLFAGQPDAGERHRYVVAVLKDRASRGGSRCVHEQLRVGMQIKIRAPRNNFHLHEEAATPCWWRGASVSRRCCAWRGA
jgi:hypothetical protein